ncbi:MAG: alginate export family protein, partial [Planctomycetota bacterium]|nr:alginate export family protein [Planctomycetota bacterium]
SGSESTGNGFHSYVQRAHYYLGFMDLYGRRNLEDLNIRFSLKPLKKLTFLTWCHFFALANGADIPYNVNMKPYAGLEAGDSGSQTLGTELDFSLTYDFDESSQLRVSYSHFWSGSFYRTTAGVPFAQDANFLYSHFVYRF